jgi:hypothetical protein
MCCYTPNNTSDDVADSAASPTKRRHLDTSPPSMPLAIETSETSSSQSRDTMQSWDQVRQNEQEPGDSSMTAMTAQPLTLPVPALDHARQGSLHSFRKLPSRANTNGLSEETNIYTETRMLQDQTGRLRRYPHTAENVCLSF